MNDQFKSAATSAMAKFRHAKKRVDCEIDRASLLYNNAVQAIADKHNVFIATGHMSDAWKVGKTWGDFVDEYDNPPHPAFRDLEKLDKLASEIRIGPSNMERYYPRKGARLAQKGKS